MTAKLKVAMCWDDAVTTDIRLISLLHKYNAKATFNINPGLLPQVTEAPRWVRYGDFGGYRGFCAGHVGLNDLKAVYGDFCVASHNWKHENAGTIPDEAFLESALHARHFLEDLFGRECPGFAWPCGVTTPATADLLRQNGFRYGRTTQNTTNVAKAEDPLCLPSNCHFLDAHFYAKYEAAKKETNVFYFWGHTYETLNYEMLWQQLEFKIEFITNDPDAEWVNVVDLV
ncbi:MAG: polysaccharide deacetylase family protein [Victivallales bacterium]|nr:polysaccharide deacetylase family protein [Victivallales bacterium]